MHKIYSLSFILIHLLLMFGAKAQSGIPSGSCGIQYTYDAAGNMIDRQYVCNNSGVAVKENNVTLQKAMTTSQAVDVVYPNPTTGRFTLRMVKSLKNAQIIIMDMQGRMIHQRNANGNMLQFDLSREAAGMYILRIQDEGETFTAKVLKQ